MIDWLVVLVGVELALAVGFLVGLLIGYHIREERLKEEGVE